MRAYRHTALHASIWNEFATMQQWETLIATITLQHCPVQNWCCTYVTVGRIITLFVVDMVVLSAWNWHPRVSSKISTMCMWITGSKTCKKRAMLCIARAYSNSHFASSVRKVKSHAQCQISLCQADISYVRHLSFVISDREMPPYSARVLYNYILLMLSMIKVNLHATWLSDVSFWAQRRKSPCMAWHGG